jgi:hypothetical protein
MWVNTHKHGARQLILIYIDNETLASGTLHLTCPWLPLVPDMLTLGWKTQERYFETPGARGYMPRGRRKTSRLFETIVRHKSGEWLLPLHVATCRYLSAPPFTIAPKLRSAETPADAPNNPKDHSSHPSSRDMSSKMKMIYNNDR